MSVELVIVGRARDIDGFAVRRVLPSALRRLVGPFVFLDHMGPVDVPPGGGMDVRPHPHIGLATVTWLLDGEIDHRDSLGSHVPIRPGEVNWMVAGRGIVHSERTSPEKRASGQRVEGVQAWVALPAHDEEMAPSFEHHGAEALPRFRDGEATITLILGTGWGHTSPVGVRSPTLYAEVRLSAGASFEVPPEVPERALYVVRGALEIPEPLESGSLAVLRPGASLTARATVDSVVMVLGGEGFPEGRHIWWNLVSSRPELIEAGAAAWRARTFPVVPGDEVEFVPAPGGPLPPR